MNHKSFANSGLALGLGLVLAGCATPTTKPVYVDTERVQKEREIQQEIAVETGIRQMIGYQVESRPGADTLSATTRETFEAPAVNATNLETNLQPSPTEQVGKPATKPVWTKFICVETSFCHEMFFGDALKPVQPQIGQSHKTALLTEQNGTNEVTATQSDPVVSATEPSTNTACENASSWNRISADCNTSKPNETNGRAKQPTCEDFGNCAGTLLGLAGLAAAIFMYPPLLLMALGGGG